MRYDFDKDLIKHISKNCGSKVLKKSVGYLEFIRYHSPKKFFCIIVDNTGFLAGTFAKKHFRLIDIAVLKDMQGTGIGKIMLSLLFEECIKREIYAITFRTPMDENSHLWYEKLGAKKTGIKQNDYEMRFDI